VKDPGDSFGSEQYTMLDVTIVALTALPPKSQVVASCPMKCDPKTVITSPWPVETAVGTTRCTIAEGKYSKEMAFEEMSP
jgi:hypothetical protein